METLFYFPLHLLATNTAQCLLIHPVTDKATLIIHTCSVSTTNTEENGRHCIHYPSHRTHCTSTTWFKHSVSPAGVVTGKQVQVLHAVKLNGVYSSRKCLWESHCHSKTGWYDLARTRLNAINGNTNQCQGGDHLGRHIFYMRRILYTRWMLTQP